MRDTQNPSPNFDEKNPSTIRSESTNSISPDESSSTIKRGIKDRAHPYVQVRRTLAQDDRLSFEARGLMLYLVSKPEGWTVMNTDLLREGKIGLHILKRLLRELEAAGWMSRKRVRASSGQFIWERAFYECLEDNPYLAASPQVENQPMANQPSVDEPSVDEPSVENQPSYIKQTLQKTDLQKTHTTDSAHVRAGGGVCEVSEEVGAKPTRAEFERYARNNRDRSGATLGEGWIRTAMRTGEYDEQVRRWICEQDGLAQAAPVAAPLANPDPTCSLCLGTGMEHVFGDGGRVLGVKPTACSCRQPEHARGQQAA
jgi:hypothetical protein